jgi:hypothetical protein
MRWSSAHLIELEADLRRQEVERVARARRPFDARGERPAPLPRRWRTEAGRGLMRLGARLAGLEAIEHGRGRAHWVG